MKRNSYFLFVCLCLTTLANLKAQEKSKKTSLKDALEGFTFRSIGPAFMSGRIADIAIDSSNENTWYVAAGSGGLWKTSNAGTTWTALTDNESFYSTGCVTIDPLNSQRIWLGTIFFDC